MKKLEEEETRPRRIDERDVMRDLEVECEEKVTREGRGEICGKDKGKGNGGKGEHANRGGRMVKGDDEGGEVDEDRKGTRRPRWADWDGEEEGVRGSVRVA